MWSYRRPDPDDTPTAAQIAALCDDIQALTKVVARQIAPVNAVQALILERIKTMSDTLTAELAVELGAELAAVKNAIGNLQTAVSAAAQEISDLAGKIAANSGGAPTADQLAEMAADAQSIQAQADALAAAVTAANAPPPLPPPAAA